MWTFVVRCLYWKVLPHVPYSTHIILDTHTKPTYCMGMSDKVKTTMNLPAATMEQLKRLADDNGITRTEALRRAIATESYIADQVAAGRRVLIEDSDGQLRELAFR